MFFHISLMAIIGTSGTAPTPEELMVLPYAGYLVPTVVAAMAVMFAMLVGIIVMLRKIKKCKPMELPTN